MSDGEASEPSVPSEPAAPQMGRLRKFIRHSLNADNSMEATKPMFPVFALTLIGVVLGPVLGESDWGRSVSVVIIGGAALVALERSGAHRFVRRIGFAIVSVCAALVVLAPGLDTITTGSEGDRVNAFATGLFALLLLVTPVIVIGRLLLRPKITLDTVSAALAGYLQIGLLFATLYRFVEIVGSEPFFAQADSSSSLEFQYFSFITLTTVGYGDLTPAGPAGQSLAMAEAITGQVFLVAVVALVVGNLGRDLPHRQRDDA